MQTRASINQINVTRQTLLICVVAAVGAALLVTFFTATRVHSQTSAIDCVGVDLVILVDESGSMLTNDPTHLRVNAARNAIQTLGDNALYFCPDVAHRIAIVGFWDERNGGTDTERYVSNVVITPTLDGPGLQIWRDERESLYQKIPERSDSPGATDYRSAFETASQILGEWQNQPVGDGGAPRRRGVVLVADGGPCVYDLGCDPSQNNMNISAYMNDLKRFLDPNGASFPWRGEDNPDSVRIWFVGFRDSTTSPEYDYLNPNSGIGSTLVPIWTQIARDHGGSFEVLQSGSDSANTRNTDVARSMTNILEVITDKPAIRVNCDQPFYVDPYSSRLVVQILKIGADQGKEPEDVDVTLQYAGPRPSASMLRGKVIQGDVTIEDYNADGPNERYVIANAPPGAWSVLVTNGICSRDVDVRIRPLAAHGGIESPLAAPSLPQYDTEPYYDPIAPSYFSYRLESDPQGQDNGSLDDSGSIDLVPEFPLTVSGSVRNPAGVTQPIDLQLQSDGSWKSAEPIRVPVAGLYEWEMSAIAPNGAQTGTVAIRTDTGAFSVSPVEHFGFELVSPTLGQQLPVNEVGSGRVRAIPVTVQARVVDASGNPVEPNIIANKLMVSSGALLSATVRSALGDVVQTAPMLFNSIDNVFEATLRAESDLAQGALDPAGNYSVEVALNPQGYANLNYRPDTENQRVAIDRVAVVPVAVKALDESIEGSPFAGNLGCIGAKPVGFDVMLQFTNAQTGEILPPSAIAASPADLLTVHLLTAGTENEVQTGIVEPFTSEQGAVLRTVLGDEDPKAGDYVVRAQLNAAALGSQFKLLNEDALDIPVTRTLSLVDNPATCRTGTGLLIVLLAALIGFMVFNWTRRPVGLLSLSDPNTQMVLKDYSLGKGLRVLFKRSQKLSASGLESFGVKKLVVKKAKPVEAHRAIEMEIIDPEGTSLGSTTLESGFDTLVTYDVSARYE